MAADDDISRSTIKQIVRQDLAVTLITTGLWLVLGVGDWRVMLALDVLRIAAWISHTHALLQPIRAWQRTPAHDDQRLLAAARALQKFQPRFFRVYIPLWLAVLVLASLQHCVRLSGELTVGRAELLLASMLICTVLVALLVLMGMVLDGALIDIHARINRAVRARGLEFARPPKLLARRLVRVLMGLSFLIAMAMLIAGATMRVRGLRAHALEQQLRAAELAAAHMDYGAPERVEPHVRIVAADELPSVLIDLQPGDVATRGAIDPAHEQVVAAAPLADGRWALAVATPDEQLGWTVLVVLGVALLCIVRVTTAARVLSRIQTLQIHNIDATMRSVIASGNMLGGERVTMIENDEAGALGELFNEMLDMLAELAAAAKAVAAGDLRVELERPGDLYDAFRGMLSHLRDVVGEIRRTSVELASASAELHAMTVQQQQATAQQSERMVAVGNMLEVLAASAGDVAGVASTVLDNAAQTAKTTDDVTEKTIELGHQTRKIGELLARIREIAERSDLLALNGALEATRAGEAGRGFEIVAAEMRRLAERVSTTVDGVSARLVEIDRSSQTTIDATKESRELAQSTAGAAEIISSVTSEQNRDTRSLLSTVEDTNATMEATLASLAQTLVAVADIRHEADLLEALTRQFTLTGEDGAD